MKDSKQSRRKVLKSLTLGGAATITAKSLPDQWTKPVVRSVLLPAHGSSTTQIYTITACTGESRNGAPAGQLFQTGGEAVENITATVTPVPPVGTVIRNIPTVSPVDLNYNESTSPTDSGGLADQFTNLGLPNAEPVSIGSVFTLRFEFDDQGTFGGSSCEVQLTVISTP